MRSMAGGSGSWGARWALVAALSAGVPLGHVSPAEAAPKLTQPVAIHHVDAVYPDSALKDGKHGDVVLRVTIDVHGHVTQIEVLTSAGKELDTAAIVAMRQWTFKPALRDGKPIPSRIRVPFHFSPPSHSGHEPHTASSTPSHEHHGGDPHGEVETSISGSVVSRAGAGVSVTGPPPGSIRVEEDVFIRGRGALPSRGTSDIRIDLGLLRALPRGKASDLLTLAPGFLLTSEGGEGHARQVFLRGFDAREAQDIEITVGGIPINDVGNLHGNGYGDTHFILPELVRSLRVLEGPYDPRQGNFAVAGSADYELGLDERGIVAKYSRGSYGTDRVLLLWGPQGESVHTFAGAELYRTDGYGQNRQAKRATAMAQYEGTLGQKGSYRLGFSGYATSYGSAGVVRQDDYLGGRIGFYDSYDPWQGGDSSRFSVNFDVETRVDATRLRQQIWITKRSMRLRENFTGYLHDAQEPLQNLHGQRGDRSDLSHDGWTLGGKGSARWKTTWFELPQEIEVGYSARHDIVGGRQVRVESATEAPYRVDADFDAKLTDIGLYGDLSLRPFAWMAIRGGLRANLFAYDVTDNCAVTEVAHPSKANPPGDQSCLSQQDFGRYREPFQKKTTAAVTFMPRASLVFGPFRSILLSASYGEGVRSIDPVYIAQNADTPFARIRSFEFGMEWARSFPEVTLTAKSAAFQTMVERDLIFSETAGRNVLGGSSTRTGVMAMARATGSFFDHAMHLTLVRSKFDDTGLLVPYVPDLVFRSDSTIRGDLPLPIFGRKPRASLSTGISYVGRRALPFGQRSDTLFTWDAATSLGYGPVDLELGMQNLLDRRYRLGEFNYASDFRLDGRPPALVPARHFSAGAPRTFMATLAVRFGGGS